MKHLEASKKIIPLRDADPAQIKYSLVQRLRSAFHIETVGEGTDSFQVTGLAKTGSYGFTAEISLKVEHQRIRVLIDGQNNVRMGTMIFYLTSLLLVLLLSLFSDSLDTTPYKGIAMNATFFLIIGAFIIYDHNKKMEEPQQLLEQILNSLEAEFG